jgi:uncharacterized protein (TIGR00297 family)
LVNWLIGFCVAGLIALLACRLRLLTAGGAWAAVVVGTSVFGAGGIEASLPMVGFFFTSSLLPRVLGRPHATEQRTAAQVLANGLAPTLCCWGAALLPAYAEAFWRGYLASVATATADTWATEFGVRFGNPVWHITTRRRIPAGESGGVSWQGTLASAAGASLIALSGQLLVGSAETLATAAALGCGGMMLDSLLGATLQARYRCNVCAALTEQATCCGMPTQHIGGLRAIENNTVNALSTLATATAGFLLGFLHR